MDKENRSVAGPNCPEGALGRPFRIQEVGSAAEEKLRGGNKGAGSPTPPPPPKFKKRKKNSPEDNSEKDWNNYYCIFTHR